MTRRTPPTPIYLLPSHIATPPRGTPKYVPPAKPPLIPLTDSIGPKLRIHAYRIRSSSGSLEAVILPDQELGEIKPVWAYSKEEEGKAKPPWLRSRGFREAAEDLADTVKLAEPARAWIRA